MAKDIFGYGNKTLQSVLTEVRHRHGTEFATDEAALAAIAHEIDTELYKLGVTGLRCRLVHVGDGQCDAHFDIESLLPKKEGLIDG